MNKMKLVIEGCNLAGKSTVMEELENRFTDCFVITLHGYYRENLEKNFPTKMKLIGYLHNRLMPLAEIFNSVNHEEVFFLRLHLTDIVYCDVFLNHQQNYRDLENALNKYKVGLILLDANDETIKTRLRERSANGKAGPWDDKFTNICNKRDKFLNVFEESQIKYKKIIDTSDTTANQAADKIIKWWNSLRIDA